MNTKTEVKHDSFNALCKELTPPSQALAQATQPYADGDMLILEPAFKDTVFEGNVRVRLRAYNGQVPGPMITVTPGRTLRIRVRNRLTPYDSSGWPGNHNVPHALDTTNLHVHGLNVMPHLFEPLGTSDPGADDRHPPRRGQGLRL